MTSAYSSVGKVGHSCCPATTPLPTIITNPMTPKVNSQTGILHTQTLPPRKTRILNIASTCIFIKKKRIKINKMESHRSSHNLFEVYLRLRPPPAGAATSERILTVEASEPNDGRIVDDTAVASHIILNPPTDRRRAIERFAFTRVFEENASQLDVFHCAEVVPLVEGVLAPNGGEGTDAMVATLGVTGSGKVST